MTTPDCEEPTALRPDDAVAHYNRGTVLQKLRRYEEALASYDAALALAPDWADAYNDRGTALENLQRHEEALANFGQAAALQPQDAGACFNQGNALLNLQRFTEALGRYDRAISIDPRHADAHFNRGTALSRLHRYDEALASYAQAILLRPGHADAVYNQGIVLMDLGRHAEALVCFDRAISLNPHHADAFTNRGNVLKTLRRYDEALASYDMSIALRADNARACLNKAQLTLALGRFSEAWPLYESRWALDEVRPRRPSFSRSPWRGSEPIAGKAVLLHAEQGLGDMIQFCRYVPVLAGRRAKVVLEVPRLLTRLLGGLAGEATIVAQGDPLPDFDLHCPLMSVPGLVGTTVDTIPAAVPYLMAEAPLVARWRERLPPGGLRIGINWQGNPSVAIDRGRSAPLANFAPLARVPGVRLFSLQKHHGLEQLDRLPAGMTVETLEGDFDSGADAFVDTAAVIMNLDLVISTDTSIVHLAGALGRPVWVAIKADPHWTWMIDRDDSPWYPSARLFRQVVAGDWREVFERMAKQLIGQRHA